MTARALTLLSSIVLSLLLISQSQAQDLNPKSFMYVNGKLVGDRYWVLGDRGDYWLKVTPEIQKSATGRIKLDKTTDKNGNEAMLIEFTKRGQRNAYLVLTGGPAVDWSKYENNAALTFDVRVDKKPKAGISFAVSGKDSKGLVYIEDYLKGFKKGEWNMIPIPLNCFSKNGADLTDVSRPLRIESEDKKAKFAIANLRLEKLPPDFKGCAQ